MPDPDNELHVICLDNDFEILPDIDQNGEAQNWVGRF